MDILIQQDGRIQTNIVIPDALYEYQMVELLPHYWQECRHSTTTRQFRKMGTEGNIKVWMEVR